MPKKEYGWATGEIPRIAPHSLAKHRILREYVRRYIEVFTSSVPAMDALRLTLVDGFAGGGEYRDASGVIVPGSPQILIDAVRAAEIAVNTSRAKQVRINANYFFVEKDPLVAAYLRGVLGKRPDRGLPDAVTIVEGEFDARLPDILSRIKSSGKAHRTILVLDQYGYTDVPLPVLSNIFRELPNAEVFLTLAVGWITAYLPNARVTATKLGIAPEVIDRIAAIDDENLDVSDASRRPDLLAIQRILHLTFTSGFASHFYTPFFIVSRESNRPYWFLHLANNPKANDVVKTLHWEIENHFEHFGRPGLSMLGYDTKRDPDITGQGAFKFDNEARRRSHSSLLTELPLRIRTASSAGVTFADLQASVCNETPATQALLSEAINELCVYKELEKVGAQGEQREATTALKRDDVIRVPKQLFLTLRSNKV